MSARYCSRCGAEVVAGALYCHRCGASINAPTAPKDHFPLGLLLIKIGATLSFMFPFLMLVGINVFTGGVFMTNAPGMFFGIFAVMLGMGAVFGAIAFKFHNDIAAGRQDRTVHAMILAAVMFFLGSNIAGIIVGIGAFLCYSSPRKMARTQ